MGELNSYDGDHMAHQTKHIYYVLIEEKSLLTPGRDGLGLT